MTEAQLTVGDFGSRGGDGTENPCVTGCAHLFLGSLFVMGEGRGGAENGRVESRLAVSAVLANFRSSEITDPQRRLDSAIAHAGKVLYQRSRSAAAFNEAWAACTSVLVRKRRLYVARVGDVQVYVIRRGKSRPLFTSPGHGGPVLGMSPTPEVDGAGNEMTLESGDRIIIGNAAFFDTVPEAELLRVGSTLVPAVSARRLVEAVRRVDDGRAVSVQVIQVGGDSSAIGAHGDGAAVAPAGHYQSHPVTPPDLPPGRPRPVGIKVGIRRKRSILPVVGALGILAAISWFLWSSVDDESKDTEPAVVTQKAPAKVSIDSSTAVGTPAEVEFWSRVSQSLDNDSEGLDAQVVRTWISETGETERRLREARAVIAALEAPVSPDEDSDNAEVIEDAAEELKPDKPVVDSEQAEAAVVWDPDRLPTNLKVFERIFSIKKPMKAANKLKNYLHKRHRYLGRVMRLLESYLAVAPKARSVTILELVPKTRAGPRTRRWAKRQLDQLQEKMSKDQ